MTEDRDAALVLECRRGNRKAFETLLGRYERSIFNAAFRMLNHVEDAKDVTQTTFLKAFENLERYNPRYKFFSWVYRIALNESINLLNRRKRLEPVSEDRVSEGQSPEEELSGGQLSHAIQDALMQIKPQYRTVIVLKHFLGCSYRDISQTLEIPEKAVKSRLFTARQLLRDRLANSEIL